MGHFTPPLPRSMLVTLMTFTSFLYGLTTLKNDASVMNIMTNIEWGEGEWGIPSSFVQYYLTNLSRKEKLDAMNKKHYHQHCTGERGVPMYFVQDFLNFQERKNKIKTIL